MQTITTKFFKSTIRYKQTTFLKLLIATFAALWFYMYYNCIDVQDWFIENILVFIYAIYALVTFKRFKFTNTSYLCIFLFLLLHTYGAMYAYTQNPIGEFLQNNYQLQRNPYDRIVHFSFGFLLAYPLYDMLKNKLHVKDKWQYILPINIIATLATIFELIEWTVAELATKETGETYVATQGDVWDAHKDIVLAIAAATVVSLSMALSKLKSKGTSH